MNTYLSDTVDYPFQMCSTMVCIDRRGVLPLYSEGDEDDGVYSV